MNGVLVILSVAGSVLIAVSGLKILEVSGTLSVAARIVVLAIVGLALYSAIESMSWCKPVRPATSFLIFLIGGIAAYKTFSPWPALLTRPPWAKTPDIQLH